MSNATDSAATVEVGISEDEAWPTYDLSEDYGERVEVPVGVFERWKRVIGEYEAAQLEMQEVYKAAREESERAKKVAALEKAVADAQAKLDAARS